MNDIQLNLDTHTLNLLLSTLVLVEEKNVPGPLRDIWSKIGIIFSIWGVVKEEGGQKLVFSSLLKQKLVKTKFKQEKYIWGAIKITRQPL